MNTAALILQCICIILVTGGIAVEYHYEADLGFLLITLGAFFFAVSEKFAKRQLKRHIRKLEERE